MDKEKETVTLTDTEEETPVDNGEEKTTQDNSEEPKKPTGGYVKTRVDRAKEQTEKALLEDLGVDSIDSAKTLIQSGQQALSEVQKLKAKLEQQEQDALLAQKRNALIKVLDGEKVFDSEALANYVDLDKVTLENGEIQDTENIVASLKKAKPNFFGVYQTVSDSYIKGKTATPKTAVEKQKEGDTVGAISDYLSSILK